jgi:Arc/MetJ-type ribon-helix-helix transcriptional regulator
VTTTNKEVRINVRVDPDLKEQILKLVDAKEYEDVAGFVRAALIEKLDPSKRKGITEEQVEQMILRTLRKNPSLLADQLKDIGLQFVLKE